MLLRLVYENWNNSMIGLKKYVAIALLVWSVSSFAQDRSMRWAAGVGGSFIKFSDPVAFLGEGVNFQIPNLSLTRYFGKGFSIVGAMTITGIDSIDGFYTNNYDLTLMDFYGKYDFGLTEEKWVPYIIGGFGMLVKDKYDRALSLNGGIGLTYWLFPRIGLNSQIVYRAVPSHYENAFPSHTQISGSLVFTFGESKARRNNRRNGHGFTTN